MAKRKWEGVQERALAIAELGKVIFVQNASHLDVHSSCRKAQQWLENSDESIDSLAQWWWENDQKKAAGKQ